ncbi:MAG: response regulator [Planctomycetota bacterium]
MKRETILIIEDEIDILEVVEYNLAGEGYKVLKALDGESGLLIAREKNPGVILLDLMLPGMGGKQVCQKLKQDPLTRDIPVIMVTAKSEETDVIVGLGLGADDYVTKPFRPKELIARIQAVARRSRGVSTVDQEARIQVGDLVIDPVRHELLVEEESIEMTATEFRIMHLLMSQPGRVFTREQISSKALGQVLHPTDRNIDVHVKTIRKKLGERRDAIETVRGVGYRLTDSRR